MTKENNRRMPSRQRWPFPNCGIQATICGAICAAAWMLLLLTSPSERVDRLYEATAILAGVLAGMDVHAARAVARVNGHVSHTVSEGVESVTGVVDDAMDVTETLQDHLIGMSAERAPETNVHPFKLRAVRPGSYYDVAVQRPRPMGEDASVVPLRGTAS